jgi:hypothetical protein
LVKKAAEQANADLDRQIQKMKKSCKDATPPQPQ